MSLYIIYDRYDIPMKCCHKKSIYSKGLDEKCNWSFPCSLFSEKFNPGLGAVRIIRHAGDDGNRD